MTVHRRPFTLRTNLAWTVAMAMLAGMWPTFVGAPAGADDFSGVEIESTALRGGLHMLTGRGGNLVVSTGRDGVLLIDDQYAPLSPKILKAVGKLDSGPIRWVVNTHWHGDHTGGNEAMAGAGGVIVAHDHVRERMGTEQFVAAFGQRVPPAAAAALPVVTFSDAMSFHFNDDEVRVTHVPAAHTDGDAFVAFRKADVVHTGDVFFNGMYPFFDASSGGRFAGMIAGANTLLEGTGPETLIVPGHGPLARRADLIAYRDMLVAVQGAVSSAIRAGDSREEIVASRPTRAHDARFGGGFLKPDSFVALVYESLKADAAR